MTDPTGSQDSEAGTVATDGAEVESGGSLFRRTILRVMSVQVVALLLLWLLQRTYGR